MTFNELNETQKQQALAAGFSGFFGDDKEHGVAMLEHARATGDDAGMMVAMVVIQNANILAALAEG